MDVGRASGWREVGCIPQTVILRYLDLSVCPHTNTYITHRRADFGKHTKECISCLDRKFVRELHDTYLQQTRYWGSRSIYVLEVWSSSKTNCIDTRFDLINSCLKACARIAASVRVSV